MTWNGTRLVWNSWLDRVGISFGYHSIFNTTPKTFDWDFKPRTTLKMNCLFVTEQRSNHHESFKQNTVELLLFCSVLCTAYNIIWTCPSTAKRLMTALASISWAAAAAAANTSGSSLSSVKSLLLLLLISLLRFRCSASTKRADDYREKRQTLQIDEHHAQLALSMHQLPQRDGFILFFWEKLAPRTKHLLCSERIFSWGKILHRHANAKQAWYLQLCSASPLMTFWFWVCTQ